ncbi:hypothetical protein ACFU6I_17705 [Streptomyces sp. NPDC057486]
MTRNRIWALADFGIGRVAVAALSRLSPMMPTEILLSLIVRTGR